MEQGKEIQQAKEKLKSELKGKDLKRFLPVSTKKMKEEQDKFETEIVLGGLAYMGERGDGIARPKLSSFERMMQKAEQEENENTVEESEEDCTCVEPQQEVKVVEDNETYHKDIARPKLSSFDRMMERAEQEEKLMKGRETYFKRVYCKVCNKLIQKG
ncbi:hypothetical protein ACQUY5_27095 [Bacillus cereus]|uniref:hypothetical protein n=1 Tax=Bacillus cereus TaxID=1396 RepID=UPI003D16C941